MYIYIYIERERERERNGKAIYADLLRRRENMVGVNMVGVNMAFHDAICGCFEGTMLEPCLLKPCFHVSDLLREEV